ncbi:pentapeptide repeat-containing protein [Bradyrhizobium sp.]
MTVEPDSAPQAPPSPAEPGRFASFAELRAAHMNLRSAFADAGHDDGAAARIRDLMAQTQRTGAVLTDPAMRKAAQGILDYWCAELAGLANAKPEDFAPLSLAPPSALPAAEAAPQEDAAAQQGRDDQRMLIRLAGMARQWHNAGRQQGYLLTGDALAQARPFAQKDNDLLEFVEASDAAERAKRRRNRNIAIGTLGTLGAFLIVAGIFIWQFYALPLNSKAWIRQIKETRSIETKTNDLSWLATFQPWSPPYDFSGTPQLWNIWIPKLRMYAPNFSGVPFSRVWLQQAQLPSASFSQSRITMEANPQGFDGRGFRWYDVMSWWLRWLRGPLPADWKGIRWNDFTGAELKLAQFREATIITTSFAKADLYRAVFDRALLCDVNFSDADLLHASFWGATIDDRTYSWLRKTAWWIAVGWNSDNFRKLLQPQSEEQADPQRPSVYPPTNPEDARALRHALRSSERFHTDVEGPIKESAPGTFDRALALNDMAWTLATWGIEGEDLRPNPAPCNSNALPKDALEAASQAICITDDLISKGSRDRDYEYWRSGFRDTLAYILMQADRMAEARALYEKDIGPTESDGGSLFRYAIALYATGDEAGAHARFETAIQKMQFLPSSELQNLKQYIPVKVLGMAYELMDQSYPAPRLDLSCPATKSR